MQPIAPQSDASPETVTSALLYLMTTYQRTQCPCVAAAVARHLDYLARMPGCTSGLRTLCVGLSTQWQMAAFPGAAAADTSVRNNPRAVCIERHRSTTEAR